MSWITYDPTYINSTTRHLKFIWNLHTFCIILFIFWVVLNIFKVIRCFSRIWMHFSLCFFNIHCISVVWNKLLHRWRHKNQPWGINLYDHEICIWHSIFDNRDIANYVGGNSPCITCSGGRRHCSFSKRGFTQRI